MWQRILEGHTRNRTMADSDKEDLVSYVRDLGLQRLSEWKKYQKCCVGNAGARQKEQKAQ